MMQLWRLLGSQASVFGESLFVSLVHVLVIYRYLISTVELKIVGSLIVCVVLFTDSIGYGREH